MEHFVNQGFKASQLLQLNRCRVYFQVLTLADIVSTDGLCIIPDILVGAPLLDQKSTLNWPNQQRPPAKDWAVWSSALKFLQPRNKLTTPLGKWFVGSHHQKWFWYMDPVLPYLYHQPEEDRPWHSFNGYSSSGRNTRLGLKILFDLNQGRSISLSPPVLCPATVTTDKHTQLTTAIRGPVFPRALTSGQASAT